MQLDVLAITVQPTLKQTICHVTNNDSWLWFVTIQLHTVVQNSCPLPHRWHEVKVKVIVHWQWPSTGQSLDHIH